MYNAPSNFNLAQTHDSAHESLHTSGDLHLAMSIPSNSGERKKEKIQRDLPHIFKDNIEYYLHERNMTQTQLAEKIGVSRTTFYRWMTYEAFPNTSDIQRCADALHVHTSELVLDSDYQDKTSMEIIKKLEEILKIQSRNENYFQRVLNNDGEIKTILTASMQIIKNKLT